MPSRPRIATLFSYDWDRLGFARSADRLAFDGAGFDLFSFPSNARLIGFDLQRFADAQARRGRRRSWAGVVSHHEQFGALAAALVAQRLGLPGTSPESIVAAQHKLHARRVLQRVAPEANLRFAELDADYGADVPLQPPAGLAYPLYVKPVKAAFSVLARHVANREALQAHTRFGRRELWVIRRLVEPFERVSRAVLPEAGSAHRLMLEEPVPVDCPQFNLDGWVFGGQVHALGVVDAIMYPGTQAFMRWEYPSRLPTAVQARALDVARRFLQAIGFSHGLFNMEFFHDPVSDRLSVIEFNPRLASQFSDLYQRVQGVDPHAMSLALALGQDPATLPRRTPSASVAASLVYRSFPGVATIPPSPTAAQHERFARRFADGLVFSFPKAGHGLARDFKWTGSHRFGIVHLGARDRTALYARAHEASALLGWPAPCADLRRSPGSAPAPAAEAEAIPWGAAVSGR
jgi:hypothetical protein